MPIIEVDHVTKEFRLGQLVNLRQSLRNGWARLSGGEVLRRQPFKALADVSFNVEAGEVVGIIGHNGAGKSTLLKLLAGISRPTTGRVAVRGRVAPLIEVGAGLVPDLTGRENIYLNGTILGMRREEIKRKFDEIVAFAELEEFIDTPLKRYSSGMQVRLGFSIATAIESEVLIIDEVLAVGDLAFQRKCFDRMQQIIRDEATTVLLVSHNIRHVERLCTRVLMLSHGAIVAEGIPRSVCDKFYETMNRFASSAKEQARSTSARFVGSGEAEVVRIDVIGRHGLPVDEIRSGDPLELRVRLKVLRPVRACEFHIGTHTTDFFYLTGGSSVLAGVRPDLEPGIHEVSQRIDAFPAKPGNYCVRFALLDGGGRVVFNGENLRAFRVAQKESESLQDELRVFDLPMTWAVEKNMEEPVPTGRGARVESIHEG
jgi:ABC-type polysaccharide/polyol phosphate transport system ATPase subunit